MNEDLEREVVRSERVAREDRGLPPWHVLSMTEFPFAFARKELADFTSAALAWAHKEPANIEALSKALFAELANGHYGRANERMAQLNAAGLVSARGQMRFGVHHEPPAFILPEVRGTYPAGSTFFLSCDANYFNVFGIPLLKSIAAANIKTPLHLHLMARDSSIIDMVMGAKGPMAVTATWEDPSSFITSRRIDPGEYYGAARLIRFAEAVHHSSGAVCMLDVDSLAHGDPMSVLNISGDIGLRVRPGRIEPWHQFSACMVLGRSSARGYFDQVSNIVKHGLLSPWWGLDQYALFSAWIGLRPEVTLFGPQHADVSGENADGVFLFTAGASKKSLMTAETPYARLYRKYR